MSLLSYTQELRHNQGERHTQSENSWMPVAKATQTQKHVKGHLHAEELLIALYTVLTVRI